MTCAVHGFSGTRCATAVRHPRWTLSKPRARGDTRRDVSGEAFRWADKTYALSAFYRRSVGFAWRVSAHRHRADAQFSDDVSGRCQKTNRRVY